MGNIVVLPCSAQLSAVGDRARHGAAADAHHPPTPPAYTEDEAKIRYYWFLSDGGSDVSEARFSRSQDGGGDLRIDGVRMADEGEFVCVAVNNGGRDVASGYLDVIGGSRACNCICLLALLHFSLHTMGARRGGKGGHLPPPPWNLKK